MTGSARHPLPGKVRTKLRCAVRRAFEAGRVLGSAGLVCTSIGMICNLAGDGTVPHLDKRWNDLLATVGTIPDPLAPSDVLAREILAEEVADAFFAFSEREWDDPGVGAACLIDLRELAVALAPWRYASGEFQIPVIEDRWSGA